MIHSRRAFENISHNRRCLYPVSILLKNRVCMSSTGETAERRVCSLYAGSPGSINMLFLNDKLNLYFRWITIGTVFLLCASCFLGCLQKKLKQSGYIRFLYVFMILSGAGAAFLFLAGLICVFSPYHIFADRWTFFMTGWRAASGKMQFPFIIVAGCVWTAGVIRSGYEYYEEQKYLKTLYMLNQPITDAQMRNSFECAAEKAEIKNIPLLFSNQAVRMPCIKGILCPAIIIPAYSLSSHEQMLVFAHELEHYSRHDLILRYFQRCVLAVYWFLPIRSFWMELFVELQETLCDIEVCRSYGNRFSAKMYYMTILSMSVQGQERQEKTDSWFVSRLADQAGQLVQRIGNMAGYRSGSRKKGFAAAVTAAGSILFLVNIFAGIYWPDIFSNQNENINNINQTLRCDEVTMTAGNAQIGDKQEETGDKEETDDLERIKQNQELKWKELTVYHLASGEKIGSEVFRGEEGRTLIFMATASEGGYEVRLMNGEYPVAVYRMEETGSLNVELHNDNYRLDICNPEDYDIKIEMYCAR